MTVLAKALPKRLVKPRVLGEAPGLNLVTLLPYAPVAANRGYRGLHPASAIDSLSEREGDRPPGTTALNRSMSEHVNVATLDDPLHAHRTGDSAHAAAFYCEILKCNPINADALHLLGVIAHQRGNHVDAIG